MDYMHIRGRDPLVPLRPDPVSTGIHAEGQYARVMCVTLTASPLVPILRPPIWQGIPSTHAGGGGCV